MSGYEHFYESNDVVNLSKELIEQLMISSLNDMIDEKISVEEIDVIRLFIRKFNEKLGG